MSFLSCCGMYPPGECWKYGGPEADARWYRCSLSAYQRGETDRYPYAVAGEDQYVGRKELTREEPYVGLAEKRVGDKERERYSAHLRMLFTDGYLDQEEFEDSNSSALKARTYGQLQELLRNLPAIAPESQAAVVIQSKTRLPWQLIVAITLAAVVAGLGLIAMIASVVL